MIRLQVEEYCHNCKEFEPVAHKSILHANFSDIMVETIVRCKNCDKCKAQYDYLKTQEKTNENNTNVINPRTDW